MTSIFEKNLKFAKQLYTEIINHTENPKKPVIYLIEIGSIGELYYRFYIGKASKGIIRPMKHYPKFVNNYEDNIYRKTYKNGEIIGERKSWRKKVHIPLSEARKSGKNIKLTMINVDIDKLDIIEQTMKKENIKKHGFEKTLNSISF